MAEAIPLGATLSVERVAIVVGNILGDCLVAMLKGFAAERGLLGDIERETGTQLITNQLWMMCRDVVSVSPTYSNRTISPVSISCADALTRCGVKRFSLPSWANIVSKSMDPMDNMPLSCRQSYLIILSPYPGGTLRCTGQLGQFLSRRELAAIGIPGQLVRSLGGFSHCVG